MTEERIDFSVLDPERNPERFDAVVREVSRLAMQGRREAPGAPTLEDAVIAWWRPVAGVAALVTIIAIPTLTRSHVRVALPPVPGIPEGVSELIQARSAPSMAELAEAFTESPGAPRDD